MTNRSSSTLPASNLGGVSSFASVDGVSEQVSRELSAKGREQTTFFNPRLTPAQFRATPEFEACRSELFRLFFRLASLLPAASEGAVVASAVRDQASQWSALEVGMSDRQALMLGAGKHLMVELCLALADDQRPSTRAAACRALRPAFLDRTCHEGAVTAIGRAVSVVLEEKGADQAQRRRGQASSALMAWASDNGSTDNGSTGWSPSDVAAGLLEYLGYDEAPDVVPDTAFEPSSLGSQAINAAQFRCVAAADPQARRLLPPPPYTARVATRCEQAHMPTIAA